MNKIKEFIRWAIQEGPWEGCDLEGSEIHDKAFELGLIVKTEYDPSKHGENDVDAEPGDEWFVFSPELQITED